MVTEGLDIGGAETHVVTLANRLAALGHEVVVLSGGGRLADTLVGVTHHRLPRFRKSSVLRLFFSLFRFFQREKFDVIHAHTRFAAFLCRPLVRGRLVTTAHWVFDTAFPKKQLSVWGDGTLAVSPDIADYLSECYRLKREEITLTVNGIDTEKFIPAKEETRVRRIVCCTRMDEDRADASFLLLEAAAALSGRDFSLTLIGDGDRFEELKQKHSALLKQDPTLDIRLVGGVSDVAVFLKDADIFVGVSRAALEGMAAGCATVLAGNEGYLSVFSPKCAEEAEKSNFCCRGAVKTTKELLVRDLSHLLSLPRSALLRMGEENRLYVLRRYSDDRMARDALAVYERICKRVCVLCGYYGFRNVGDTLLSHALRRELKKRGYGQVILLSSKHLSLKALRALKGGYDLFLGGGNLLQDTTSKRSLSFYLFILSLAKRFEIYGGIGPLSALGEARVKKALTRAAAIHARTSGDALYAERLGGRGVRLSADTALTLPRPQKAEGEKILLALRTPKESDIAAALAFALYLSRTFGKENLLLFVMHPKDAAFSKRLASLCGILPNEGTAKDFLSVLPNCRAVFASRLHAGVAALGAEIPFFLFREEEKCRFFVEDVRSLVKENGFCGLFSYSDRPKALPQKGEIKKARKKMLARI